MVTMGLWPGIPVGGQGTQPYGRVGLSLPVQSQLQPPLHLGGRAGAAGQGSLPAEHEAAAGVLQVHQAQHLLRQEQATTPEGWLQEGTCFLWNLCLGLETDGRQF